MQHEPKIKPRIVIFGDLFLVTLIILVVGLPFYIYFSGSKLSYTPEPEFPAKAGHSVETPLSSTQQIPPAVRSTAASKTNLWTK